MFNWIESLFSSAANIVTQAVRDLVHAAIRGLYSFLHIVFGNVIRAWNDMWGAAKWFVTQLRQFMDAVYARLFYIVHVTVKWLANWINWTINFFNHLIIKVWHDLFTYIRAVFTWANQFIHWLWNWTIVHIYDPLRNFINQIFKWIATVGATMWHYFTHLADFAELLFWHLLASLEKHAWDAARVLGRFLVALIVRNVVTFAHLMEDIVSAIL